MQRLNTSFVPPRYFITFELFSLSRRKGPKCDPKKWEKYAYIYIKIMQLLVHTLIPALCSTLYLPPFLRRHPLQLIKTIPPHLTQKSTKCPGDSEKSEVKKTVLDHESININSEYLEKNLSEQGTEVTTNSNTAGRQVLSPLLQRKGAEVSFYLNCWEIEKTVYLMLKKSVNSGLTMLSNN